MEAPSGQLFLRNRLFLPGFRDDETLYSWCAHYHALSSMPTARQTCLQLFGHSDAGLKHDFPIHLDRLIERTLGHLGSRDQIIFDRTPISAFSKFVDRTRLQAICALMGSGPEHRVARMLGLLANKHGTPAPLKACPECVSESVAQSNSSSWRSDHQTPGIYFCELHGGMLRVAVPAIHRRSRSEFLLPHTLAATDWLEIPTLSSASIHNLKSLAVWSRALRTNSTSNQEPFTPDVLRDTCHLRARERGWVCIDGSLHFKQIQNAVNVSQSELFAVPGLEFLAKSQSVGGGYLGLLMRQAPGVHHPLMFIALLSLLFESPDHFLQCYQFASEANPNTRREVLRSERNMLSEWLKELVVKQGKSVNQAAKEVGIHPSRALVYLKEQGIECEKRPRIVDSPLESKLVERLEFGDDPATISSEMDLRRSFIKDYLASHPEIRRRHANARFVRQCGEYRAKFLSILDANPSLPVKRIRRETNSGFEWLLRHDRNWLTQILPGIWHR